MKPLVWQGALWAADPRLEKFTQEFRGREPQVGARGIMIGLLLLALMIVSLWILARVIERRSGRKPFDSSLGLFVSLCAAHQLRWRQRWLLWRLARAWRLAEPARLFVEPHRFETKSLGERLAPRAAELKEIAQRLFAEPAVADNHGQSPAPKIAEQAQQTPIPERPFPLAFPIEEHPALDVPLWPANSLPAIDAPDSEASATE
jgi:hypothetical protein